jgi:hypothetical protein
LPSLCSSAEDMKSGVERISEIGSDLTLRPFQ